MRRSLVEQYPAQTVIVPPSSRPVSLDDVKGFLQYEANDQDVEIDGFIRAATEKLEKDTERAYIEQTRRVYYQGVPRCFRINCAPVAEIVSVDYIDAAGAPQTVDPADYRVDLHQIPALVVPVHCWPATSCEPNAASVTFRAGYDVFNEDDPPLRLTPELPYMAREAVKFLVRFLFHGCGGDALESPLYAAMVDRLRWRPLV